VGCEVADEVEANVTVEDISTKLRDMATLLIGEKGKDQEVREWMAEEMRQLAGLLESPGPEV
jgi:hypothetical protein